MSTTDAATTATSGSGQVVLPSDITVMPGRQTSITNGFGQVTQGTQYPILLSNGTVSSVFVPTSAESNVEQVQAIFDRKIASLSIVPVS
jgi:hypothetical protein